MMAADFSGRDVRLTRYAMYRRLADVLDGPVRGDVLGVSGIGGLGFLIDAPRSRVVDAQYPEVDIQRLPYDNERFDWVLSDQVLEHVADPFAAVAESHRVLRRGGIAIHTTCFMNYYHPAPIDYWRFSPSALRYVCRDFSEVIEAGGWGNRLALMLCFLGDRFRAMRIPDGRFSLRRLIAVHNDERYPISTWIVARK